MKSVVFDVDRTVRLAERPEPRPSDTDVLLRPAFVGICGTDLHAAQLDHFRPGVIMGHEFAGRVVATGRSAQRFSEGDLVVVNPNGNRCDTCEACQSGRINLCAATVFERGIGIHEDGGMAELVSVHERVLTRVPPAVTEQAAAWTEPLATAVRAFRWADIPAGSSATVIGAGPIGLLVTQLLAGGQLSHVRVLEPSPFRREMAHRMGATETHVPQATPSTEIERTDVAFECSGSNQGFSTAMMSVRPGGTVIVVGLATHLLTLKPFALVAQEIRIQGSIIYDDRDFDEALSLLARGAIDVAALVTDVMPLDDYAEAFRRLKSPETATKILLHPVT